MDRLKMDGDNEYEVLGLSSSATTDDMNAAFHHLIDEGHYRVGVPPGATGNAHARSRPLTPSSSIRWPARSKTSP
jgi:hypothetical protein